MPFLSAAVEAGTCCVSIWIARFASEGRVSRNMPALPGSSADAFAQKCGVKKATGPLKLAVFRKSVQHWLPVGTSFPSVFTFGLVRGNGR